MASVKIMHVDADEDVRTIAEMSFGLEPDIELMQFGSGQEALENVDRVDADVIVLDYVLPEMNGLEILKRLRGIPRFARTPAVFVTAKAENETRGELMDAGAAGVITKPFDPMTLAKAVIGFCDTQMA